MEKSTTQTLLNHIHITQVRASQFSYKSNEIHDKKFYIESEGYKIMKYAPKLWSYIFKMFKGIPIIFDTMSVLFAQFLFVLNNVVDYSFFYTITQIVHNSLIFFLGSNIFFAFQILFLDSNHFFRFKQFFLDSNNFFFSFPTKKNLFSPI